VIINPGYEPPEARVATCEAGVCLGKPRFGYETALGEGISRDPLGEKWFEVGRSPAERKRNLIGRDAIAAKERINLYGYVLNNPANATDLQGLKVYQCCAPINVDTWEAKTANAVGFRHCWLKTGSVEAGMGPNPPSANLPSCPFGTSTEINNEAGDSTARGAQCTEQPNANEECVNKALQIGKDTGSWGLTNNCNTLADGILAKCTCKYKPGVPITTGPNGM
jgi:hypothetical protein